ncbi:MAG: hypothetical protein AAB214_16860, partial [Fibrobacterota bacterium]
MRFLFPIVSLWLAGALAAQTDSVVQSTSTDSVVNAPDTSRAVRTIPVSWLPMEVHRFAAAELDSAVTVRPAGATGQIKTKADSGTNLRFGGS